ncbi:MAG: carbohydrate-binding domain-containing protein [Bacteroidaceae bacterium]|nr:carbohydrate-binding domain-containing protein [Bacteroidaceae bacterium]
MRRISFFLLLAVLSCAPVAMAQTIAVHFDGESATVNIPDEITNVTANVNGAYVTINSTSQADPEYTYSLSGQTTNGGLIINGVFKLTLELNGVSITSQQGAAIDVECGKRVAVVVAEGTDNTLADCAAGLQKAAMYFSGHPEFSGGGTLNVTGNTKHAISAKEYLQIKKSFGTLNVLGAVSDGIHCGKGKIAAWDETMTLNEHEFFLCNGGNINISNVGGDCIDAGDYGCMYIKGGALNLEVSALDACAMKCVNTFILEGGQLNIEVTGDASDGIYINNQARFLGGELAIDVSGNGSKGIKGKNKATSGYADGGNITIDGTVVSIVARGGDDNTDPLDPSHCVGISVDGNLECGGDVTVTAVGEARGVTCDGTLTGGATEIRRHWYADPHAYRYDMSAYLTLEMDSRAVLPAEAELAVFVDDECRGVAEACAGAEGVYYLRVRSNATAGETLTFKAYVGDEEIALLTDAPVVFNAETVLGSVGTPLKVYNQLPVMMGDLNGDGILTVTDVTLAIAIVLGNAPDNIHSEAADLNADGVVTVTDVVILISRILGQN